MVGKIITIVGKSALKKVGNTAIKKVVEKIDKPFAAFNREVLGIKQLNVGEDEELDCYKRYPNNVEWCKRLGQQIRKDYQETGKYYPYSKNK